MVWGGGCRRPFYRNPNRSNNSMTTNLYIPQSDDYDHHDMSKDNIVDMEYLFAGQARIELEIIEAELIDLDWRDTPD